MNIKFNLLFPLYNNLCNISHKNISDIRTNFYKQEEQLETCCTCVCKWKDVPPPTPSLCADDQRRRWAAENKRSGSEAVVYSGDSRSANVWRQADYCTAGGLFIDPALCVYASDSPSAVSCMCVCVRSHTLLLRGGEHARQLSYYVEVLFIKVFIHYKAYLYRPLDYRLLLYLSLHVCVFKHERARVAHGAPDAGHPRESVPGLSWQCVCGSAWLLAPVSCSPLGSTTTAAAEQHPPPPVLISGARGMSANG